MMFDGMCNIRNEKRYQDDVAHSGSVAVLPARDGNTFAMNVSKLDQYITNINLVSHLGKSIFYHGISMSGVVF